MDTKEVPRTKLFAVTENGKNENFRKEPDLHCYESIVSDQFHEKDETAKDSLVCNLFSPYPTHQHSHCSKYNTRSAARLKDEAIGRVPIFCIAYIDKSVYRGERLGNRT